MGFIDWVLFISLIASVIGAPDRKLQASKNSDYVRLRTDGLYALYDTSKMECGEIVRNHYFIYSPLVFIDSSKVFWLSYFGYFNSDPLLIKNYKDFKRFQGHVGKYFINQDTLLASLPIGLFVNGMRERMYEAHFQGIIKNRDTITNWHMIPPYPNGKPRFNNNYTFLKTHHTMYFVEGKELLGLDSLCQKSVKEVSVKDKK